ncbi:Rne/Rng family ribonuclease [Sphingomonas colocasiae]|uniref:Ribonuclease E n=1 Tax=Sphingomonas colocasiae TaxID=1848973 RepID=A0ABS7PX03_9SPHN|nr:ribonuclease E/G [Sphingomonas colocasiae]MBY8825892.1 Rne/Rng family ribonuclease [Sphingomonas colocasiae]
MTTRMLIDARHREETRVAVVKGHRIEEFDFESAEHKQLKGNIYLAKVTRVEPSLQAAFVDYGGNRHGFLAFSEIHPDYYQIPKEDREALLREEAEHAAEEEALRAAQAEEYDDDYDGEGEDGSGVEVVEAIDHGDEGDGEAADSESEGEARPRRRGKAIDDGAVESLRQKRMNLRRRYKIQDVIRRRQVLLVQVVKEERGNKGAALTTYLSLAGRYCVLMPNTSHGGGISRKISNAGDRKRLKTIMAELKLPSTMGCIVRTAGLQRTKTEIKRDFDYLARLWDEIREKTLQSTAPALVYGDSDLIKRAIRDIYNRDIEEVIIEGEEGYRAAKDFMKLLMPSHARRVKPYSDAVPLFQRNGVEDQLAAMYHPTVQLKSGGYLVINPTEALVSIDINSGRSTREHGIEQTAVATNLEAAHEIARQLRLRDMAGLVVIDFIDMENNSNIRKVEKAMKAALANDRARIQVGRISSFGLMEMSRQRLRTGVLEASTRQCPHCEGTGLVRTASSAGLSALRMLEDEAARGRGSKLTLRASQEAAVYVLNRKRAELAEIEDRYGVTIDVLPDGEAEGARMSVEASGPPPEHAPRFAPVVIEDEDDDLPIEDEIDEEEEAEAEERRESREERGDREGGRRRRRRRGRRGRRDEEGEGRDREADAGEHQGESDEADEAGERDQDAQDADVDADVTAESDDGSDEGGKRRRGRRGRRGGKRRREGGAAIDGGDAEAQAEEIEAEVEIAEVQAVDEVAPEPVAEAPAEKPKRTRRKKAEVQAEPVVEAPVAEEAAVEPAPVEAPAEKPKRTRKKAAPKAKAAELVEPEAPAPEPEPVAEAPAEEAAPAKPKRTRKKAAVAAEATAVEAVTADAVPADADQPLAANDAGDTPRRGWWQRTFGGQE